MITVEFRFAYKKEIKNTIKGTTIEDIKVRDIRALYSYSPETIWINLSSIWFKTQIDDKRIMEISDSLQHEYLHKAIRVIEDDIGVMEKFDKLGHLKEEKIIAEITGHNFNSKVYEKQRWN